MIILLVSKFYGEITKLHSLTQVDSNTINGKNLGNKSQQRAGISLFSVATTATYYGSWMARSVSLFLSFYQKQVLSTKCWPNGLIN